MLTRFTQPCAWLSAMTLLIGISGCARHGTHECSQGQGEDACAPCVGPPDGWMAGFHPTHWSPLEMAQVTTDSIGEDEPFPESIPSEQIPPENAIGARSLRDELPTAGRRGNRVARATLVQGWTPGKSRRLTIVQLPPLLESR